MELPDLALLESIARRHLPDCFRLQNTFLTAAAPGNPAPFRVLVQIERISDDADPGGWMYALGEEIRRGWDIHDFELAVYELPSSVGRGTEE